MVSADILMSYPDWKLPFKVHTDASYKQLGAFIIQNNKTIDFFSRKLSKPQRNYTTTDKELLVIVECIKQSRGIIFGYEINVFSDHKNLVYAATLSEPQRVMPWRLILKKFGPTIQHDLISCDYKPLVVRIMCLGMYWLHNTVLRQYRSREKMIPKIIFTLL